MISGLASNTFWYSSLILIGWNTSILFFNANSLHGEYIILPFLSFSLSGCVTTITTLVFSINDSNIGTANDGVPINTTLISFIYITNIIVPNF